MKAAIVPVPEMAMYCFPPTMQVIGVALEICARLTFHSGLPVLASATAALQTDMPALMRSLAKRTSVSTSVCWRSSRPSMASMAIP